MSRLPIALLLSLLVVSALVYHCQAGHRSWSLGKPKPSLRIGHSIKKGFHRLLQSKWIAHKKKQVAPKPCGDKMCGPRAYCVNQKCVCKSRCRGAPQVECVRSDYHQCVLQCDPHATAFAGAHGSLNFPCKYRLTRLQTPLEGGTVGLAFCSFEIFGFNKVVDGRFFTSGVEISFALLDPAKHFFRQKDIVKYDINAGGVQTLGGRTVKWGSRVHQIRNGIKIECKFDALNRFAILSIPQCGGFSVKFRPFDDQKPTGVQPRCPAISIVVGPKAIFGASPIGRYPHSLCGQTQAQGDNSSLYHDRAVELGLQDRNQALLFDMINQGLTQEAVVPNAMPFALQDSQTCQDVVDNFHMCATVENQTAAIRLCSTIMFSPHVRCLDTQAVVAFSGCMKAFCVDKATGCNDFSNAVAVSNCPGPSDVVTFCA